jgi:hypothetical protein
VDHHVIASTLHARRNADGGALPVAAASNALGTGAMPGAAHVPQRVHYETEPAVSTTEAKVLLEPEARVLRVAEHLASERFPVAEVKRRLAAYLEQRGSTSAAADPILPLGEALLCESKERLRAGIEGVFKEVNWADFRSDSEELLISLVCHQQREGSVNLDLFKSILAAGQPPTLALAMDAIDWILFADQAARDRIRPVFDAAPVHCVRPALSGTFEQNLRLYQLATLRFTGDEAAELEWLATVNGQSANALAAHVFATRHDLPAVSRGSDSYFHSLQRLLPVLQRAAPEALMDQFPELMKVGCFTARASGEVCSGLSWDEASEAVAEQGYFRIARFGRLVVTHAGQPGKDGRFTYKTSTSVGAAQKDYAKKREAGLAKLGKPQELARFQPLEPAPISEVVRRARLGQLRELSAAGADMNERGKDGWRPVHIATNGEHPDLIQAVLAAGADPNLTTDEGYTALDVYSFSNDRTRDEDRLRFLLEAEARFNTNPHSLYHLAAYRGRLEALRLLEAHGFSRTDAVKIYPFDEPLTPLQLAERGEHPFTVEHFKKA